MTITVNAEAFKKVYLEEAPDVSDVDQLNSLLQSITESDAGVFEGLPDGAQVVVYYIADYDDPGFIVALRPYATSDPAVSVTTYFMEARDICNPDQNVIEVAVNLAYEIESLVPAYRKLWMATYSKTVYVEIEAVNEDEALEALDAVLAPLIADPGNNITYVDLEGPIEEC